MSKPNDPPIFAEDDGVPPPLPTAIPWRGIAHLLVGGVLVYYVLLRGFVLRVDNALGVLFDFVSGVCVLAIPVCFLLAMVARRQGKKSDPALEEPMIRWGVRITAVVLALQILFVVALVVIGSFTAGDKVSTSDWKTWYFGENRFSMRTPPGWRHAPEHETGQGDLTLADESNTVVAGAYAVPKSEISFGSLVEFRDWTLNGLTEGAKQISIERDDPQSAGEMNFADAVVTVSRGQTEYFVLTRQIEAEGYWIEIRVWTTTGNDTVDPKTIEQIVYSFEVLSP